MTPKVSLDDCRPTTPGEACAANSQNQFSGQSAQSQRPPPMTHSADGVSVVASRAWVDAINNGAFFGRPTRIGLAPARTPGSVSLLLQVGEQGAPAPPPGFGPSQHPGRVDPKEKFFPPEIGDSPDDRAKIHRGDKKDSGVRGDPLKPVSEGVAGSGDHAGEGGIVVAVTQTLSSYPAAGEVRTGAIVWFFFKRTQTDTNHSYCWIQLARLTVSCAVSGISSPIPAKDGESHDWCIDGDPALQGATGWTKKGDTDKLCYSHGYVDEATGSVNLFDIPQILQPTILFYATFLGKTHEKGGTVSKITLTWNFEDYLWCITHKYILDSYEWMLTVEITSTGGTGLQVKSDVTGPSRRNDAKGGSEAFKRSAGSSGPPVHCPDVRKDKKPEGTSFPGVNS